MHMGFAKAIKLLAVYRSTSTINEFVKKARELFPDDDILVPRAMWYAWDVMDQQPQAAAPTTTGNAPAPRKIVRERMVIPSAKPATKPAARRKRKAGKRG
jgi:hypothetical protein